MSDLKILVDMDDTICDQTTPFLKEFNKIYKTNASYEDLKVFYREDALRHLVPNLTDSDLWKVFNKPGFFRNLRIMPGAIDALKEIKARGWRTVIVTSLPRTKHQPGQMIQEKLEWIREHLTGLIAERDIVITHEKYLVKGDILIDDAEHNLKLFPGATIAFHQPWNEQIETTARVKHWNEVADVCEKLFSLKTLWARRLDERQDTLRSLSGQD